MRRRSFHDIMKKAPRERDPGKREVTAGMAAALWVKTIRHHRTDRQATVPCRRDDPREALLEACRQMDLPEPLWLDKNEREWREFGMTRFLPDAFFEAVAFERMEIEYIDPDAPKKKNRDPRNAF